MKKEFWETRWKKNEIGFHQDEVNTYLAQYWDKLELTESVNVFIPLCGKSKDILWLSERCQSVLGVEISSLAVHAYFHENNLKPDQTDSKRFRYWTNGNTIILCGNYFDLDATDLREVDVVYDRASLIALPEEMREQYISHLLEIIPGKSKIFLVTLEYPQSEMQGPPFSVDDNEVQSLFANNFDIKLMYSSDILDDNIKFKERGLQYLRENVYLLTRKRSM
jgi:thiopurine S-methyltransferase